MFRKFSVHVFPDFRISDFLFPSPESPVSIVFSSIQCIVVDGLTTEGLLPRNNFHCFDYCPAINFEMFES